MKKIEFCNQINEGIDEILALKYLNLMQHYGFGTRLLDITKNKAVALYFACNKNFKENGYIYTFNDTKYRYLKDINGKSITRKFESIGKYYKENKKNLNEMYDSDIKRFTVEKNVIMDCDNLFNELNNIRYKTQEGSFILIGNEIDENNCLTGNLTEVKIFDKETTKIDSNKKLLYLYMLCCEKEEIKELDVINNRCICYVKMFPDDEFAFKIVSYWERIIIDKNLNEMKFILKNLLDYLKEKFKIKNYYFNINSELAKDIFMSKEKFYFFCYEFSKYYSENICKFKKIKISNYKLKDLVELTIKK